MNMFKTLFILSLLLQCVFQPQPLWAQDTETDRIAQEYRDSLKGLDDNMVSKSRKMKLEMIITDDEGVHRKKLEIIGKGYFTSLARATAPARDKGTKMLRMQRRGRGLLYLCMPGTSRVIRLSGHMLRQSFMGSDLSYEDLLDAPRLGENYEIVKGKEIEMNGEKCYDLHLKAMSKSETYPERRFVIEKKRHSPVLQELFAGGGKKLKILKYGKITAFGNRHYPLHMTVRNLLRKNSSTSLEFSDVKFDVRLPRGAFTRRYLEREW